eukprot:4658100-Prymnesium_polylepis.1
MACCQRAPKAERRGAAEGHVGECEPRGAEQRSIRAVDAHARRRSPRFEVALECLQQDATFGVSTAVVRARLSAGLHVLRVRLAAGRIRHHANAPAGRPEILGEQRKRREAIASGCQVRMREQVAAAKVEDEIVAAEVFACGRRQRCAHPSIDGIAHLALCERSELGPAVTVGNDERINLCAGANSSSEPLALRFAGYRCDVDPCCRCSQRWCAQLESETVHERKRGELEVEHHPITRIGLAHERAAAAA